MSPAFVKKIVASAWTEIAKKTILATKLFSALFDFHKLGCGQAPHCTFPENVLSPNRLGKMMFPYHDGNVSEQNFLRYFSTYGSVAALSHLGQHCGKIQKSNRHASTIIAIIAFFEWQGGLQTLSTKYPTNGDLKFNNSEKNKKPTAPQSHSKAGHARNPTGRPCHDTSAVRSSGERTALPCQNPNVSIFSGDIGWLLCFSCLTLRRLDFVSLSP